MSHRSITYDPSFTFLTSGENLHSPKGGLRFVVSICAIPISLDAPAIDILVLVLASAGLTQRGLISAWCGRRCMVHDHGRAYQQKQQPAIYSLLPWVSLRLRRAMAPRVMPSARGALSSTASMRAMTSFVSRGSTLTAPRFSRSWGSNVFARIRELFLWFLKVDGS